jgi:hypothetical protein
VRDLALQFTILSEHRHAKKKEYCIRTFCFQIYLKYECEGLRIAIYNLVRYTHTHTHKKEYCIRMLSLSKIPNEI